MDFKDNNVILYTVQTSEVFDIINSKGIYYPKIKFITKKYGEVSNVFLFAYNWYSQNASKIVPKPIESESGIWVFKDEKYLDIHPNSVILKLCVPINEVVFFKMSDWNKVLNLRYIGQNEEDELKFSNTLVSMGIKYEGDIVLTPYYPQLKNNLIKSFNNLFKYNDEIKSGNFHIVPDIQGGIWKIEKSWIADYKNI